MPMPKRKFRHHEPVWAKLEGYPWWPARIVNRNEITLDDGEDEPHLKCGELLVEFFNDDKRFATIRKSDLRSFLSTGYEGLNPGYSGKFKDDVAIAVSEVNDYCQEKGFITEDARSRNSSLVKPAPISHKDRIQSNEFGGERGNRKHERKYRNLEGDARIKENSDIDESGKTSHDKGDDEADVERRVWGGSLPQTHRRQREAESLDGNLVKPAGSIAEPLSKEGHAYGSLPREKLIKIIVASDKELRSYRVQVWQYRLKNAKETCITSKKELMSVLELPFKLVADFLKVSEEEAHKGEKSAKWKRLEGVVVESITGLEKVCFDISLLKEPNVSERALQLARDSMKYSLAVARALRELIVLWFSIEQFSK